MPDLASTTRAFAPFSTAHLVVLVSFVLGLAAIIVIARRLRETRALRRLEVVLAIASIACWIGIVIWWLLPENLRWEKSLPMALCDWASLIAALGLFWPRRFLVTVTYFWGIGLCTQAFFTPTLTLGPVHAFFWIFWVQHAIIVAAAIYHFAARNYRPGWKDYWIAICASYAYLAMAMLVNHLFAANYGFVGNQTPATPTIVDQLGPWPRRILWIVLLVHVAFALAMIPVFLANRLTISRKERSPRALD